MARPVTFQLVSILSHKIPLQKRKPKEEEEEKKTDCSGAGCKSRVETDQSVTE
jgi:hypothetical protein